MKRKTKLFFLLLTTALLLSGCGEEKKAEQYLEEEKYTEAIEIYETLISEKDSEKTKEKNQEIYTLLGQIYCYLEDYERALESFGEASLLIEETEKELPEEAVSAQVLAYNELGISYMEQEAYEEALEYFEAGLYLEPAKEKKQSLLRNKIIALEHLGRFKKAFSACETYFENYPEDEEMRREYEFLKTRVK